MMIGLIYTDLERLYNEAINTSNESELFRIAQEFNSLIYELEQQGRSTKIRPIEAGETERLREEISRLLHELK